MSGSAGTGERMRRSQQEGGRTVRCQREFAHECVGFSRKWGRSVRVSAESGQENEYVSLKWHKIVIGISKMWGKRLKGSVGIEAGV